MAGLRPLSGPPLVVHAVYFGLHEHTECARVKSFQKGTVRPIRREIKTKIPAIYGLGYPAWQLPPKLQSSSAQERGIGKMQVEGCKCLGVLVTVSWQIQAISAHPDTNTRRQCWLAARGPHGQQGLEEDSP